MHIGADLKVIGQKMKIEARKVWEENRLINVFDEAKLLVYLRCLNQINSVSATKIPRWPWTRERVSRPGMEGSGREVITMRPCV